MKIKNHSSKIALATATGTVLAFATEQASAMSTATSALVTSGFTTLKDDVISLVDLAWTAAIPVTVAFIVLKLFKKAAGSAV